MHYNSPSPKSSQEVCIAGKDVAPNPTGRISIWIGISLSPVTFTPNSAKEALNGRCAILYHVESII